MVRGYGLVLGFRVSGKRSPSTLATSLAGASSVKGIITIVSRELSQLCRGNYHNCVGAIITNLSGNYHSCVGIDAGELP